MEIRNVKKWVMLAGAATALLIIPRRSSQKASIKPSIELTKKKNDKKRSHIPFRLNLLFFVVFLLFATLILRLGYLQIVKGEEFETQVQ
ncbi:MAG: hypothetical protein ABS880_07660, partial [Psychrobacter alimentarius]